MKRVQLAAGSVSALTAAVLALSATPASASGTYSGLAYVYGAGAFADDWGNEGIVDQSHNTSSNATCLWQKILYADGLLEAGDIDGVFGKDTAAATSQWQSTWTSDTPDGSAGKLTWTAAGQFLFNSSGTRTGNTVSYYSGLRRNISLSRDSDGYYHFTDGNDSGRIAGYDYRTCS
ncbi:peptidoglycan-binding domain-containing protein [Streptomyces cellulosae]|uniref:Peptidoglycan-binding protein n=1 Tax=Streptomyces cellulosae TaxID=1968 RepID=A0ABW7XVL0_STRCE